jgi:hypothetical protein
MTISDEAYDKFSGLVDAEEVYRAMAPVLRCRNRGRLWIYWEGFSRPPSAYKLE